MPVETFDRRSKFRTTIGAEFRLRNHNLFKQLTESELTLLERLVVQKLYKKNEILYREGCRHSGIYIIQQGIVKISKRGVNGKLQVLRFAQIEDIIAYRSIISNEVACSSARAYSEVVVSHIPYTILLDLLKQNWKFTHEIMKMICNELGTSNTFITNIAQKSVRERTAEMLLFLKDEFGVDACNALQITIRREDLANMVGTATESLIRIISEFRNEGLLACQRRKIIFLNTKQLKRVANI